MKLISYYTGLLLIPFLFTHCKEESPEQKMIDKRHKEIMLIHDEVMPKISEIYSLKKKLRKTESNNESLSLIDRLEEADEAMMEWMHQYKKPKPGQKDLSLYFDNQLKEIKIVSEKMINSINNAGKFLADENS